jgi:hypothetical protein
VGKAKRLFELLRIPWDARGPSRRRPLVLQGTRRGVRSCATDARQFADIARCGGRTGPSSPGLPVWQSAHKSLRLSKCQQADGKQELGNCCAALARGEATMVDFSLHLHVSGRPWVSSTQGRLECGGWKIDSRSVGH